MGSRQRRSEVQPPCGHSAPTAYQLHVLLHDVEPAIWRRLHVRSDTTLADLHVLIQIAFAWRGWSFHQFIIRGKIYGRGMSPENVSLADFGFHSKERFVYEYGCSWRVQVRMESTIEKTLALAVCVAGARAGPSEKSRDPDHYAAQVEYREENFPWDELHLLGETLAKFVNAQPDASVRDVIGDGDMLAEAVDCVDAYYRNDPASFKRRMLNRRFKALADDDRAWREYDESDDDDSGSNRWG